MKKINFLLSLVFFSSMILFSCKKEDSNTSKPVLKYVKIDGEKKILASNILNKKTIATKNGVVLFFDKQKEKNYSNALTFVPYYKKDIPKIEEFLKAKKLSFEYNLHYIKIWNGKDHLLLAVKNEHTRNLFNKNTISVLPLLQLSFLKGYKFKLNANINKKQINNLIENALLIKKVSPDNDKVCTSGGEGATSCSIDDPFSGCSVSCASGYYACCESSNNTCRCVKEN